MDLCDPGSVRNVVEIGRGKAFFSEHLQRSIDDLAGPRLLRLRHFGLSSDIAVS
jgi:hypothetical protein